MYCFPNLEPVPCPLSSFNCFFLTYIQISQEAGQMVWYSHLLKNFPQFVVIHTVKGFSIVNKAEVDVFFWNSLGFSMIQQMLAIWILVPLPFLNPAWTSGSSWFTYWQTWSTGEGNNKPLQYSCLESPMNSMKGQKERAERWTPQVSRCPICYWKSVEN